jgi:hypothetical protein
MHFSAATGCGTSDLSLDLGNPLTGLEMVYMALAGCIFATLPYFVQHIKSSISLSSGINSESRRPNIGKPLSSLHQCNPSSFGCSIQRS